MKHGYTSPWTIKGETVEKEDFVGFTTTAKHIWQGLTRLANGKDMRSSLVETYGQGQVTRALKVLQEAGLVTTKDVRSAGRLTDEEVILTERGRKLGTTL